MMFSESMTTHSWPTTDVPVENTTVNSIINATTSIMAAINTTEMTQGAINTTEVTQPQERDPLDKMSKDMLIYGLPVILVVGLVGNSLNFVVMRKQGMRKSPISVYLTALAIVDSLVLALDFFNNWPKSTFQVKLLTTSTVVCKLHRYLFDASYTYAAWLITMIAIERFLVISFPLKAKTICTRRNATIAVSVVPAVLGVFYLYNLVTWDLIDGECDVISQYAYFMNNVHPWLTGVLYSYIPVAVLFVCNIAIIIHLVRAHRRRKNLMSSNQQSNDTVRISVMVLTISVMYLVLTVPLTIFYLYLFAAEMFINMPPYINLLRSTVLLLALSNHALNFFLYVFSSSQFRKDLIGMFVRKESNGQQRGKPPCKTAASINNTSKDGSVGTLPTGSTDVSKGSKSNVSEAPSQDPVPNV